MHLKTPCNPKSFQTPRTFLKTTLTWSCHTFMPPSLSGHRYVLIELSQLFALIENRPQKYLTLSDLSFIGGCGGMCTHMPPSQFEEMRASVKMIRP